jgi:class 3 adenylate cyclase
MQVQTPTIMGPCVNRAAKMTTHAPRDRNVLLIDDNFRRALQQVDHQYDDATTEFDGWWPGEPGAESPLKGYRYYEIAVKPFASTIERHRHVP